MERLHDGWLIKSPPEHKTQRLFPAKWRRRYFVLYVPPSSGTLPGKSCPALLDYYSNDKMTRKRGSIDLENCHTIIANIQSPYYKFIFVMKTVHKDRERDYYLASDSKEEMDAWVNILCNVVGLNRGSYNTLATNKPPESAPSSINQYVTPTKTTNTVPSNNITSKPISTSERNSQDYFDLTECCTGMKEGNGSYSTGGSTDAKIFIYQLPKPRNLVSSGGSSTRTDSSEFHNNSVDAIYSIPKTSNINGEEMNEYKIPKNWGRGDSSVSSGQEDGAHKENFRIPSSSSSPSPSTLYPSNSDTYDVPAPKPHMPPAAQYANTLSSFPPKVQEYRASPFLNSNHISLSLKSHTPKQTYKRDVNLLCVTPPSSSSDAYNRLRQPPLPIKVPNLSSDASCDTSSSSSSPTSDDENDNNSASKHDSVSSDGVYDMPRSLDRGRRILHSVFDENDFDRSLQSPTNQKVQYLDLEFSNTIVQKPIMESRVEYQEIDHQKTQALSQIRANRENPKSQ